MIGSVIDHRYRIVDTIGAGGMGSVYVADDVGTGCRVAVKLINVTEVNPTPQIIGRFEREAKVAAVIESQHVARILAFGTDPATNARYLVMEHLRGEDLRILLRRLGPLAPDLALRIVAQVCLGLQKAHESHVVHRDVKPANIFIAKHEHGERVVKLLDFGVAKITVDLSSEEEIPDLTRTGRLVGSPPYMSPEQVRGSKLLDHRTDIFSLGIVLYELLANQSPYRPDMTVGELILAICHNKPKSVQEVAPWVPSTVAAIVDRALCRSPSGRFASAIAMSDAICALLPNGLSITEEMLVPLSKDAMQSVEQRNADRATLRPHGTLTRVSTGETFSLRSEMLIGRASSCDIQIDDPRISSRHACLRWTGSMWEIADLGSKNGTFVAGRRLVTGERTTLIARQTFELGGNAAPAPSFCLVDASPPVERVD